MKQLLVIEDDEFNCMLYHDILCDEQIQIDSAHDGQQGLDKFKEKVYDLILLDLMLPKIGGLEVARSMREYEATTHYATRTPIIVITANSIPGTRQLVQAAGVEGYLSKPFDIVELRELVALFLQKKQEIIPLN